MWAEDMELIVSKAAMFFPIYHHKSVHHLLIKCINNKKNNRHVKFNANQFIEININVQYNIFISSYTGTCSNLHKAHFIYPYFSKPVVKNPEIDTGIMYPTIFNIQPHTVLVPKQLGTNGI
jgi:hypothetical protein